MSSDSVLTSVPRPDNLNYKAVQMNNGRYRTRKIPINNVQTPITIDPVSTSMVEFKLPANQVWNTSRSTIDYSIDIPVPVTAGQSNWTFEDTFEICGAIQFCNASGVYLTDLQNANMYVSVARKIDISQDDFEGGDYTSGLYKSPAQSSNYFPPTANPGVATNVYFAAAAATNKALTAVEPQYARGFTVSTASTITRSIPLSCFTQTALGMDRDYVFSEDMFVRIQIAPVPKLGFCGTDAGNPTFGAVLSAATPVKIQTMCLQLAMQVDPVVVASVQEKFQSGKMSYVIPFAYGWKQGAASNTVSSFQVSLNNQYGNRLKRMLYTAVYGTETGVNAYDHCNMNGTKVASYQTYLDSVPLQDSVISCKQPVSGSVGMDDWRENKMLVRGSAIENSAAYYFNWFHCDSFSQPKRDKVLLPSENILEGLDLTFPRQWTITATIPVIAAGITHYVWGTFIRYVQATPQGTFVTVA